MARPKLNLKNIILGKYHNFLDIFSKKNSDTLFLYQKYDSKIIPEKYKSMIILYFTKHHH